MTKAPAARALWTALLLACALETAATTGGSFPVPGIPCAPRRYDCPRSEISPVIDGVPEPEVWEQAPWTEDFVDILGAGSPAPRFRTRARMLWDDRCFYVAAELEEPEVWGTLLSRDAVIYRDNDFEVFIDPDGDTHEYYELEINALGTEWDLLLIRPYRDGGPAVHAWDIPGLETAVRVEGTLNRPGDVDRGWTVELAFPWEALRECAHRPSPPGAGDVWRVNFSRVEWRTEVREGRHVKLRDPLSGELLPEDNWVWSPQGLVNMHYPEMWGLVRFLEAPAEHPGRHASRGGERDSGGDLAEARWMLRELYYNQRRRKEASGSWAKAATELLDGLRPVEGWSWPPELSCGWNTWEARVTRSRDGRVLSITQDGRLSRDR